MEVHPLLQTDHMRHQVTGCAHQEAQDHDANAHWFAEEFAERTQHEKGGHPQDLLCRVTC